MGDNRNYAALEWVIGEIEETLKQARQALEAYVENPQDSTRIRFCLTHIHQVHGSLQMVEFSGAALLAEEMESLAQALMNKVISAEREAQEVLMRAILQLPIYLERVKNTRLDHPSTVLPLLNDLRAVRGENLLTETKLFSPDLTTAHEVRGERSPASRDDGQFVAVVKKLLQMYQYAAAGVIRNINAQENLAYLNKVFTRLHKLTQGTARQPLWEISLALCEGLASDTIESSVSVKNLLRQLNKEIKVLVVNGTKALDSFSNDELIKNLLYYVARSRGDGPHLKRVKHTYHLSNALPAAAEETSEGEDLLAAPDPEAVRSVVAALRDELDAIKHALDIVLTGSDEGDALKEALPIIKRIADTMAVLGIGNLRKQILAQGELLEKAARGEGLSHDVLMKVASRIIEIENALEGLVTGIGLQGNARGRDIHIDKAQESVLRESRNGLEQAKDAIIEYIASQWDCGHLVNVPTLLSEIRGGLEMVPLPRPAQILKACANYIQEQLLENKITPEWSTLDTLADAIASVEYYLERLSGDHDEDDELLLSVAEESVEALGYGIGPEGAKPLEEKADAELTAAAEYTEDEVVVEEIDVADVAPQDSSPVTAEEIVPVIMPTTTPTTTPTAQADEDEIDDEIIDIFIEEADEVLETIDEYFARWAENFNDDEALIEFRRAFHTLKGSGRMVGAKDIGELSWSVENLLNRVIDKSISSYQPAVALIERVRHLLPTLITAFRLKQPNPQPLLTKQYMDWGDALSKGSVPDSLASEIETEGVLLGVGKIEALKQPDIETGNIPEQRSVIAEVCEDEDSDVLLWEIFCSEVISHLQVVEGFINEMTQAAPLYSSPSDSMQRALHTLKGSAHMADINPIAELVSPLERFIKELRTYQVAINDDILQLLKDGVVYIRDALGQIENNEKVEISKLKQFIARVTELKELSVGHLIRQKESTRSGFKEVDPELLSIFMAEEMNLLLNADKILHRWQREHGEAEELQSITAELAKLERGAKQANLPPMANLSGQLRRIYGKISSSDFTSNNELCDSLRRGHEQLLDMVDAIAAGQNIQDISSELQNELEAQQVLAGIGAKDGSEAATVDQSPAAEQGVVESPLIEVQDIEVITEQAESMAGAQNEQKLEVEEESTTETAVSDFAEPKDNIEKTAAELDEIDNEILEIFVEEADEILEEIDESIHSWEEEGDSEASIEALKRALHTFKGGARLAGVMGIGQQAHEFETFLISLGEGSSDVDNAFFQQIHEFQDQLLKGTEIVKAKLAGHLPEGMEEVMAAQRAEAQDGSYQGSFDSIDAEVDISVMGGEGSQKHTGDESSQASDNVLPFAPKPKELQKFGTDSLVTPFGSDVSGTPGSAAVASSQLAARRSGPQEVIKVSADLLEELVNLAGETSISRGRMEEQVGELSYAIEEMDSTILRLQEQLRRLDIETEAQVLFRQEQLSEHEGFDPLEMDRYSQLQQLSRSLMESASDLMDLKLTLTHKTRDTETLLVQQSRINTDLQEGLMRSRMVPFSRLVPRLRRIVRQISGELGKQVTFELDNIEGELDRSVLERMVAPLEHMLRNAVDHGIEAAEERLAAGKAETGRIVLSLGREGGDVLIRLADDGRGIDLKKVREKAIERGLMRADAQLSDHDISQFILHAGFSTADKVTQISGRGVGMDVVHSEIKQLGGSMFINTRWGEGSEFIVRLPFTVSVNRALMVRIGDDRYAIPLNTIEGIVRVSPFELEHYYQDEHARFEYAGENYQVRYLGTLLNADANPKLESQALPLPVVLVRTTESTVALQVDNLLGSREIVVKSLGPQFSTVHGLSGATVMGDGSVVVILDLHDLIRTEAALVYFSTPLLIPDVDEEEAVSDSKTVLVVDDSVTVRKVTTRFLEREGYNVMTAKDGSDALVLLQDHIPSVMLLDIEMPRMDGFEVAKNMQSSSRLKHVPIIMITSRTGQKHRDRALSLGVKRYMGKPYQEDVLLENIRALIGETTE